MTQSITKSAIGNALSAGKAVLIGRVFRNEGESLCYGRLIEELRGLQVTGYPPKTNGSLNQPTWSFGSKVAGVGYRVGSVWDDGTSISGSAARANQEYENSEWMYQALGLPDESLILLTLVPEGTKEDEQGRFTSYGLYARLRVRREVTV